MRGGVNFDVALYNARRVKEFRAFPQICAGFSIHLLISGQWHLPDL